MTTTSDNIAQDDAPSTPIVLGPWALIWRKFRRHKLAMFSLYIVGLIYLVAILGEFLAVQDPHKTSVRHTFQPPQALQLFVTDEDGSTKLQLHAKGMKMELNRELRRRTFVEDESKVIPMSFFVKGHEYELLGLFTSTTHFFGPQNPRDRVFIFGADRLGRDILSRVIVGTRVSMSIGLVGVAVSLVIGVILGGISGYYGGWADNLIQRLIEFIRSVPTIPLWMGLAAAIPLDWPPLRTYFVVTIIVSMIGWTSLAREVRGKFLSLRNEEFITAARLDGLSDWEIIMRHMGVESG